MFGISLDGHPALTRILMPDDWPGHPSAGLPPRRHPRWSTRAAPSRRRTSGGATADEHRPGPLRRGADTTDGRVFTSPARTGTRSSTACPRRPTERIVVNMGPQHPSTHGVLRLILELEGETVTEARCGIGYLHTGIEKNMEFRSWTQGVTFCTRMDYLSPVLQRATTYVLGVERLLDIEDHGARRRPRSCGSSSWSSTASPHLVCIATGAWRSAPHRS